MREIETMEDFRAWVAAGAPQAAAVQSLDLTRSTDVLRTLRPVGSLFLACDLEPEAAGCLVQAGAVVVPELPGCFSVHRSALYTPEELYDRYAPGDPGAFASCLDQRIYREYLVTGRDRPTSMATSLARSLHDHAITAALDAHLEGQRVVAIMGGHGLERSDPMYREVVRIAKALAERSYLLVSGGGPGAMEATHLGAWLAGRPAGAVDEVLQSDFTKRPAGAAPGKEYADSDWLDRAFAVRERWPLVRDVVSIGIPTWLYGHEPPTPFATRIAKYFTNAIREEGLLAIAHHGVVFAPGSAGTTQEIFQDACQNHYGTPGVVSPMILLGREFWMHERPVWPLLEKVSVGRLYGELLALEDDATAVLHRIQDYEPSWYRVTDDPDVTLEAGVRRALGLRSNFVFRHVRRPSDAPLAVAPQLLGELGVTDPVGPVGSAARFSDWLLAVATDNWIDPEQLPDVWPLLAGVEVHRAGEAMVLVRDGSVSAWTVELLD